MKRLAIIAGMLLLATSAHANKGDKWALVHLWSYHANESRTWFDDEGQAHPWNEKNYGLALGYGLTDHIEGQVGAYNGAVKWHTNYERFISVGLTVGLVSGYEVTQAIDTPVTAFILPTISFHPHYRVRIDIGYLPGSLGAGKSLTDRNGNTVTSESTDLFTSTVGILF